MKRIVALTLFAASLAVAGPLKVVAYGTKETSYPVRHPVKSAKGVVKALKFILW